MRADDADILLMLTHHFNTTKHKTVILSTSNGRFCVKDLVDQLSERQRNALLFSHAFSGCDTVSSIHGFSKATLFELLCSESLSVHVDVFYNENSSIKEIEDAGIQIFQSVYKSPRTPLSTQRVERYNNQCKAGVLLPANYPPTVDAANQHALRAYLQLQDWLILKSMSRDPTLYGWHVSSQGQYEPIMTLKPAAPANLLKLISCNCAGDCTTMKCSCKRNGVKCISTCGKCHGSHCKNVVVVD